MGPHKIILFFDSKLLNLDENFVENLFSAVIPLHNFSDGCFGNIMIVLSIKFLELFLCEFV